ncbi:MAG TPA: hypothetical protein VG346_09000 [Acidimicrobiales bacterium]|jgi:hypothetical protein|nr:hypothetical protein [Acidimicrobiales bacterium]
MQTEAEDTSFSAERFDKGLASLRSAVLEAPRDVVEDADFSACAPIDYASLEFEVERMRQRLSIWEIFLRYARDGARTWTEVQGAMTPDDLNEIIRMCDGMSVRDVLLDLR